MATGAGAELREQPIAYARGLEMDGGHTRVTEAATVRKR